MVELFKDYLTQNNFMSSHEQVGTVPKIREQNLKAPPRLAGLKTRKPSPE